MKYHTKIIIIVLLSTFSNAFAYNMTCTYDQQNRLTKVIYDNNITITYQYDKAGNISRIDTDYKFALLDAISILQRISGMKNAQPSLIGDINGDEQIGLEEAVVCLQNISKQN